MPRSRIPYDPQAVHCPHCGAEPGRPCLSPSGTPRKVDHGERGRLAYALMFPGNNLGRAAAERYRMKYPDVDVSNVICTPSRRQARWWSQWGRSMRYNEAQYEREHGRDTSMDDFGPPILVDEDDGFVGQSASEVLAQFDKVPVPKKKKKEGS